MTKENMINYVAAHIKEYLPDDYQDAEVNVLDVTKLNKSYTGLSVRRPDDCLVPTINLDSALCEITDEAGLKKVMKDIVMNLLESKGPDFDLDILKDYALAKDNLFMKLVNADENLETLSTIPHFVIEDLAITFHVMLKNNSDQVTSTTVQNGMLPLWGIDKDTLVKDALLNSMSTMPAKICPLSEMLGLMGAMMAGDSPLVIVTNECTMHGAAALFYPGVLDRLVEKMHGNFYILPSSIHEVLVLPEGECEVPVSELKAMVTEINATQVDPEEQLSDSIYFYNATLKHFSKIA